MGALGPGREHRAMSEINVTPLVDVMLVLLIIFMVTAPMLQQGLDVDLPETSTQPLRMQDEPLVLTVTKEGAYLLASVEVPADELGSKIEAIFEGREDKEIFLRADEAAPYGVVVKALAAAREAGAESLGIVTEPE
ncbi:MAG: biopolymer transporter ExbD [Myxococcota bacterium]|nr:biopolymer transporter ExbD [Myxococcota bacterium]